MSSTSPGPRDYSAGTVRALYALSGTTCYHPDCAVTVVRFVDGEPFSDVQIAHIRGANKDGPRYDPAMNDDQRRSFPNVMLLCKVHHELIDKRHPDRFPVEILSKWKSDREAAAGIDRKDLAGVTEERLIELIQDAVTSGPPPREITAELGFKLVRPGGGMSFAVEKAKDFMFLDTYKDMGVPALSLTIRNTGTMKIYVESHLIRFRPCGFGLLGANQLPHLNGPTPRAIDVSASDQWFYDLSMVSFAVGGLRSKEQQIDDLVAEVKLASGEEFKSGPLLAAYLPDEVN